MENKSITEDGETKLIPLPKMKVQLFDCSPIAKEKIKNFDDLIGLDENPKLWAKYPWGQMAIGQSFIERFEVANETSLRTLAASQKGKTGKTFKVVKHLNLQIFEVARIA